MTAIFKVCKNPNCGKEFYINDKDQDFFRKHNLLLPSYCWPCRQIRKKEREAVEGIRGGGGVLSGGRYHVEGGKYQDQEVE